MLGGFVAAGTVRGRGQGSCMPLQEEQPRAPEPACGPFTSWCPWDGHWNAHFLDEKTGSGDSRVTEGHATSQGSYQ